MDEMIIGEIRAIRVNKLPVSLQHWVFIIWPTGLSIEAVHLAVVIGVIRAIRVIRPDCQSVSSLDSAEHLHMNL